LAVYTITSLEVIFRHFLFNFITYFNDIPLFFLLFFLSRLSFISYVLNPII
jgi:hypothetical protein